MRYDAVVIGAGRQRARRRRASRRQGLEGRGPRARGGRRRRGQDRRGHAAGLPPRPLRDESQPVRGLAVFRRPQGSAARKAGVEFVPAARLFRQPRFPTAPGSASKPISRRPRPHRRAKLRPMRERWREMAAAFDGDAPHIFALLGSPMPSIAAAARELRRLARRRSRARRPARAARARLAARLARRKLFQREAQGDDGAPGACTSISRPTSLAGRCFPISNRWPTRISAW